MVKNFSFNELTFTARADLLEENRRLAKLEPVYSNLQALANMLQVIRDAYGSAINVNSGFRSLAVNNAINGSKTSDHMLGKAADLDCADNDRLFACIRQLAADKVITFGQLIEELPGRPQSPDGWIHVSTPGKHINSVLRFDGKNFVKLALVDDRR